MQSINGSYFDKSLSIDGIYIGFGAVNDLFCNDLLQTEDVRMALHRRLKEEGFQAVVFFDTVRMLYTYDPESFHLLVRGRDAEQQTQSAASVSAGRTQISAMGPMGRRRRAGRTDGDRAGGRGAANAGSGTAGANPGGSVPGADYYSMGRIDYNMAWQQVTYLLKESNLRCALVVNNTNALQHRLGSYELQLIEELSSYKEKNQSIIFFLFRETNLAGLWESARGGTPEWQTFAETVIRPRVQAEDPGMNRTIHIGTPNRLEIMNLLNNMRMREDISLRVKASEINRLSQLLEASVGRRGWGLRKLFVSICKYAEEHPGTQLSTANWKTFVDDEAYKTPTEELSEMIGLSDIKQRVKTERSAMEGKYRGTDTAPKKSSRFAPYTAASADRGYDLNAVISGPAGTGKTTLARILGGIYYELGLLPENKFIERTAGNLISPYVGDTPRRIRALFQEALGGTIFIDEAYALMSDQHGREAIDELVACMSSYLGEVAVIIAGYPIPMENFLRENEGLPRRFPVRYELTDYTPSELNEIFHSAVERDKEIEGIDPELEERLTDFFEGWYGGRRRDWGNAGEVKNLISDMKTNAAARMEAEAGGTVTIGVGEKPHMILTSRDVPASLRYCLEPQSRSVADVLARLDKMIGLSGVKEKIREIVNVIQTSGGKTLPGNWYFMGPPGSGKTTVAREFAAILGLLGVIPRKRNNVVEVKAAQLANGSVTIQDFAEDAKGGVGFIDEVHQLADTEAGRRVLRELVPVLDNERYTSDTCFIVAGYSTEVERVLAVDPGLTRRLPENCHVRFYDYTAEELTDILAQMAAKKGEICEQGYLDRTFSVFSRYMENPPANFGNGGFAATYLVESVTARAERLKRELTGSDRTVSETDHMPDDWDMRCRRFTAEDIPKRFLNLAAPVGYKPERNGDVWESLNALYGKKEFCDYLRSMRSDDGSHRFIGDVAAKMNYAVSGPAGSGRHLSVRTAAAVMQKLGKLHRKDVIFAGKGDLEAGYVGQTAQKTRSVISRAQGGTLCIVGPSALLPKNANDNTFGPEALGEVNNIMSSSSDDICVVLLDTKEGLDAVAEMYPDMFKNIARRFDFESLSPADMLSLFRLRTKERMVFDESTQDLLTDFMLNWVSDRGGLGDRNRQWAGGIEIDRLVQELEDAWRSMGGETREIRTVSGVREWTQTYMFITKEMFPERVKRYLKSTAALNKDALDDLDRLTGLHRVKEAVRALVRRMKRRGKQGKAYPGSYLFIGNPGVGKTMVAGLMGAIFRSIGVLEQGQVIARTARELMSRPADFDDTLNLAKDGILFIDEAYMLAENAAGNSILEKILTILEDPEVMSRTCIIMAGYPSDMMRMLQTNSGLASRVGQGNSILVFDDYTADELSAILDQMAANAAAIPQLDTDGPYLLDSGYRDAAAEIFANVVSENNPDFGNARFVRNFIYDSADAMLRRLEETYGDDVPSEEPDRLTAADIPDKYRKYIGIHSDAVIPRSHIVTESHATIAEEGYEKFCSRMEQSIVFLEVEGDKGRSEGTGTIITEDGVILTCAHVVRGASKVKARVSTPGQTGGDYRYFDCRILRPIRDDCDMALLRMEGSNFRPAPLRTGTENGIPIEETVILGYPLGSRLNGGSNSHLRLSNFAGRVASVQEVGGFRRVYIDSTGLHGNSGSPTFGEDGRVIGVFSGSIIPGGKGNLDELNYFYPIDYMFSFFTK